MQEKNKVSNTDGQTPSILTGMGKNTALTCGPLAQSGKQLLALE